MTTTNTTQESKPTTWLEHVQKHEDSASLNKVHNSVVDLFKVTMADKLSNDFPAKMLEDSMDLKVSTLLCRSLIGDDMMLIHHISRVGGDLLNPRIEYFGLSRFGKSAIPVKNPESILAINEVEAPSWAVINAVTNPIGLQAAWDPNPVVTFLTSVVPLTPFLAKVIAPFRSPTVEGIRQVRSTTTIRNIQTPQNPRPSRLSYPIYGRPIRKRSLQSPHPHRSPIRSSSSLLRSIRPFFPNPILKHHPLAPLISPIPHNYLNK